MLKHVLLLLVLVVASSCDDWVSKLAPSETDFARHCFSLLQQRDFAAIEAIAGPELRTADFQTHLADMAALIPSGAPTSSYATSVNTSTTNGYTTATVSLIYQFQDGSLKFDIATEGRDDASALTSIDLQPTAAQEPVGFTLLIAAIPAGVMVLALIGIAVHRRRAAKREVLQATPEEQARRQHWTTALDGIGRQSSRFDRLLGIRRVTLTSPLSLEECQERLERSVEREAIFRIREPAHSEVQGRVNESRFWIRRKQSVFITERYPLFLYGQLVAGRDGTQVRCSLGPQRLVLGLAAGFLLFMWTMFPVVGMGQQGFGLFSLVFVLPPLLITGFVALGFRMNGRNNLKAGPHLLDFLGQTLEATETPAVRSSSIEGVISR